MAVRRPTIDQLRGVAEDLGMHMGEEELKSYDAVMQANYAAYDIVDAMPDYVPAVTYPRTPGYRPEGKENQYNAWYVKTSIKGASSGKLAGKTVALKDNVCLAGVPMMNGASTLEGFIPDMDATIVTRILDAGGTINGKTHCEYFCFSGGSHTNATGPVHNPHKMGYSSGGSSSGSGVVVATGEADMAIGGDQGGSIRIPASFCGIYGMKGTHGLVPYTGVMPIELTLDHTGPMTRNVRDNALLLEVLAGTDGVDPRQIAPVVANYTEALEGGVRGLRIGIVKEGFGLPSSERDVDGKVMAGAQLFRKLGAIVDEVSVPMHALGPAIWLPIAAEGATEFMMKGNGMGTNWRGLYNTALLDAHSAWRYRADELSDSLKLTMLLGQYFGKHYRGHFYSKAQNLSRKLRAAYDAMLGTYDLLLMPTLPMKATPLPPADAPRELYMQRAFEMLPNTAPFNATGHPAMSIPCGMSGGLPIGLMLIGKYYEESVIYRAAAAFEAAGDWRKM
ncbi:MAG: amidase [Bradyrhizobium sp.]|jgi:amidase